MKFEVNNENVTIRDIAKFAGVSTATVSRFLNGKILKERCSHRRLQKIINESGYQLPRRKIPRILFVKYTENIVGNYDASHDAHLEHYLQGNSQKLGVESFSLCGRDKEKVVRRVRELKCSGVISLSCLGELPTPYVLLNGYFYNGGHSCVNCDNFSGMVKGLAYLREMGHERVAYFCDREICPSHGDPRHYFMPQSYYNAGLVFSPELVWSKYFKSGEHQPVVDEAVDYFLSLKPRPTAIFSSGDCYGISFYDALRRRGKSVPEDMSVIGFDGSPMCEVWNPPLTVVAKPLEKMAVEALRLLRRLIASPEDTAYKLLIEPEVIERRSVNTPRAR